MFFAFGIEADETFWWLELWNEVLIQLFWLYEKGSLLKELLVKIRQNLKQQMQQVLDEFNIKTLELV